MIEKNKNRDQTEVVFSAAQPTGVLHIGNYLGAMLEWKNLQDSFSNTFFSIVDLHAITVPHDPLRFQDMLLRTAAQYLACGISGDLSKVFVQSHVKEHAELAWILGTLTPVSWMDKMIQFKDKAKNNNASLGLYSYPVLMAADILLYKATKVPVGNDQMQHLELTKDIAKKFNRLYATEYFTVPEVLSTESAKIRIMSLKDPMKKMSKSDINESSRINILDSPDVIESKIKAATTDSIIGFEPSMMGERPAAHNLINMYSLLTNTPYNHVCSQFSNFSILKSALVDVLVSKLEPVRNNFNLLIKDKVHINKVLEHGAEKAKKIAQTHMKEIKDLMGL